ncbi:MAG: ferritin-like domain-containing protein [Williamsia sp.]|nr:ferritin-like domain-containing protein [Williamsia sp.]
MATAKKSAPLKKSAKSAKKAAPKPASKSVARSVSKAPAKPAPRAKKTFSESEDSSMLQEFMLDSVKDIYWAEKHLTKALPKLAKAATSDEVKKAFQDHLEVTLQQIDRLEQVFGILGKKPQAKKCDAMEGITKEAESIIDETQKGTKTRDAALIMAAQKVEHYEIATYGGLVQVSKTLGKNDIADILAQTLQEEKQADQLLSDIAESSVNNQAAGEEE